MRIPIRDDTAVNSDLQVVCAWPLSGQYGPGSRVLYYALVATCVLARKEEWLKGPCLVATLLIPAVAALHGIVLAALNVDGAVDMDVFGVFQVCSIGVLTAMVTFTQSKTYFKGPGRDMIFLWTGIVFGGLLSLTVEFYRIKPQTCPTVSSLEDFRYGVDTCAITCSISEGPHSPIRTGAGTNMAVIPAPTKFTFGMATLLSAACCIPAILSLINVWRKMHDDEATDRIRFNQPYLDKIIRAFRKSFEVPGFLAAVVAILVIGERNLLSQQCQYMVEPLDNVGQWAPIVGTGLAVMGSLYLLWERAIKEQENPPPRSEGQVDDFSILRLLARRWLELRKQLRPSADGNSQRHEEDNQNVYLETPGEELVNPDLRKTQSRYAKSVTDNGGSDHVEQPDESDRTLDSPASSGAVDPSSPTRFSDVPTIRIDEPAQAVIR